MNEHLKLAIQAVGQLKGDDLYRAQAAFGRPHERETNE